MQWNLTGSQWSHLRIGDACVQTGQTPEESVAVQGDYTKALTAKIAASSVKYCLKPD